MKSDRLSPNPKFIGTMLKLTREYISRGEKVKILDPDELLKQYYRFAVLIWKKDKNFILGTIQKASDGSPRLQFVVSENTTNYGYEKVGSYSLIEKANLVYFDGKLDL